MAAPSLTDGISRAIEEVAVPSVGLIIILALVRECCGAYEAGIVYVLITIDLFGGIYMNAKYWNIKYTSAFVVIGFVLLFAVPSVAPYVIPSFFANLGKFVAVGFFILTGNRILDKW